MAAKPRYQPAAIFNRRTAGVLLHPSSLPAPAINGRTPCSGNLGSSAEQYLNFLSRANLNVWQMLPTGPTHDDGSPYHSWSALAGNPDLICLNRLCQWGWVNSARLTLDSESSAINKTELAQLRRVACQGFKSFIASSAGHNVSKDFATFIAEQHYWLDDFALFYAIRTLHQGASWHQWPKPLRLRSQKALADIRQQCADDIFQAQFEQFAFYSQWCQVRRHAQQLGIALFGDIPIFVANDSVDVWANPDQFLLDPEGNPTSVAGVPPDYFSATGQHWGNPHYHWQTMQADGFSWWKNRVRRQLDQFDLIRIDHFRGLCAYWEIPAGSIDARAGQWVEAPGEALLTALFKEFDELPIVAENLGLITAEVEQLRTGFALPGMLVLQFGLDGEPKNINAPHHCEPINIVYTGTHDNDTTCGWLGSLNAEQQRHIAEYFSVSAAQLNHWTLIKAALRSVARMAIVPMQDWLALGAEARINTPGTCENNWSWQLDSTALSEQLASEIAREINRFDRTGDPLPTLEFMHP
ncbi:4-alpha-glucanotransferase [Gilvimarinus agarilyticus]|uniref:4-alpha-glucanotransferase n=1 Tax=Gilvimarinus agarilyticus TaxID=679259 RepID=UPI00059FCB1A|nr:4-alpha-glucanotransferase [Gilvimarinus agarilyticus]